MYNPANVNPESSVFNGVAENALRLNVVCKFNIATVRRASRYPGHLEESAIKSPFVTSYLFFFLLRYEVLYRSHLSTHPPSSRYIPKITRICRLSRWWRDNAIFTDLSSINMTDVKLNLQPDAQKNLRNRDWFCHFDEWSLMRNNSTYLMW